MHNNKCNKCFALPNTKNHHQSKIYTCSSRPILVSFYLWITVVSNITRTQICNNIIFKTKNVHNHSNIFWTYLKVNQRIIVRLAWMQYIIKLNFGSILEFLSFSTDILYGKNTHIHLNPNQKYIREATRGIIVVCDKSSLAVFYRSYTDPRKKKRGDCFIHVIH